MSESFEKDVRERTKHLKYITELPDKGVSVEKILQVTDENLGLGIFHIFFIVFLSYLWIYF